jgi:hypothetical protein
LKYDTKQREAMIGIMGKIGSIAGNVPVVGKTVQKATEGVSGKIQEAIPKAEKIRETLPLEQERLKMAGEVDPETLDMTRQDIGLYTPAEIEESNYQALKCSIETQKGMMDIEKLGADIQKIIVDINDKTFELQQKKILLPVTVAKAQTEVRKLESGIYRDIQAGNNSAASAKYTRIYTIAKTIELMGNGASQSGTKSYDEYKKQPLNVRSQYTEAPIRNMLGNKGFAGANDIIKEQIVGLAQNWSDTDLSNFLRDMAANHQSVSYKGLVEMYKIDNNMMEALDSTIRPEKVTEYADNLGYKYNELSGKYQLDSELLNNWLNKKTRMDYVEMIFSTIQGKEVADEAKAKSGYSSASPDISDWYKDSEALDDLLDE